jgi:hypothetical protein
MQEESADRPPSSSQDPVTLLTGIDVAQVHDPEKNLEGFSVPRRRAWRDSDGISIEVGSIQPATDRTLRRPKPRHIQLIGIGGTVGTTPCVQTGRGLMRGGLGSLFLAFTIWYITPVPFLLLWVVVVNRCIHNEEDCLPLLAF